jgi:acyl-CoA thioester hydrolase
MISHTHPLRPRFVDTDAGGVVHHARYVEYFESARIALMDSINLPYIKIVKDGYQLPVLETIVKHKMMAFFDDRLEIKTTLHPIEGVKIKFSYLIVRGQDLIAEGSTIVVFINDKGQAIRPPKDFVEKINERADKPA